MDCRGGRGRLHPKDSTGSAGRLGGCIAGTGRRCAFLGATAVALAAAIAPAQAQNCTGSATRTFSDGTVTTFNFGPTFSIGATAASSLIASINGANAAFLTQSTAFVSAPPDPKPDSQGGGVWTRGVGGELEFKNTATIAPTGLNGSNTIGCDVRFREDFSGVQFGQDVARLNAMGWNLHLGTTAGYIETHGSPVGGNPLGGSFDTTTRSPYVGTYAVATNGGFFVDGLFRYNLFETTLNSPTLNVFNQSLSARGYSFASSAGYRYDVPNANWFYEPSFGIVWSNVSVDPLNLAGPVIPGGFGNIPGTVAFSNLDSVIGRAGLRVGTTTQYGNLLYQPFFAVSVWHEFGNDATAKFSTCPGCAFPPFSAAINAGNIGTYGQYSFGINGQIVNTGWLGFARVDYRNGNHLEGWSGTGGIRYQYTPGSSPLDMAFAMVDGFDHAMAYAAKVTKTAPVFVTKAKPMVERPYNWTGWYIGGFGGADYGKGHMDFPAAAVSADPQIDGALVGGTFGYNVQYGAWVYGIEGDWGWTNATGSTPCGTMNAFSAFAGAPFFNTTCHDDADWIATLAGRIGLAWGRALYYGKFGAAWARETFSATCNLGPLNGNNAITGGVNCTNPAGALMSQISASDTRAGWTLGYGTEFGLTDRWSAKGEVDYIGFGRKNLTMSDGTAVNAGMHIWEAKVGVNYRLSP
jgi:outer membrane autotransporter protein